MKLVYIGNKLFNKGHPPTSVETLGVRLSECFKVTTASAYLNPFFRLIHMWYTCIKNRDASFILIDTYSTLAFWFALSCAFLAKCMKIPYILLLHGGDLPKRAKKNPRLMHWLLDSARNVICPSNYLLCEMQRFFIRDYELIPNYIDLERYFYNVPSFENGIQLLWVRSFHKIYNPQMAIDLVRVLNESGMPVQLYMVGPDKDGSMKECMEMSISLGLENHIQFTGRLVKEDWIDISSRCNVFINTTHVDNTPVSVMEAMALGLPVVSTNVGGIPYLLKNGEDAILVEDGNVVQMEEAVIRLITETDLALKLSRNARRKAESWDWNVVKEQWLTLLSDEKFDA